MFIVTEYAALTQETSLFVVILDFMSSWNFLLSWVEHEKVL